MGAVQVQVEACDGLIALDHHGCCPLLVSQAGSEQLRLDLKGMLFSGTVLALPGTAFVLNIGSGGEAKVRLA